MTALKRTRAPARWLLVALSGLATAGFLGAIVSRPEQTPAALGSDTPAESIGWASVPVAATPVARAPTIPQVGSQTLVAPQVTTRAPRLRTRGS